MPGQVVHTSPDIYGQIFIPEIHYLIMALAVAVVVGFRDSVHLGNAYGKGLCRLSLPLAEYVQQSDSCN